MISTQQTANNGRFKAGNVGGGRPKGSKNRLTTVKNRIIRYADSHMRDKDFMSKIPPADFMRFIASVTPKEVNVTGDYQFNLVSHIVRPALDTSILDAVAITEPTDTKPVALPLPDGKPDESQHINTSDEPASANPPSTKNESTDEKKKI